ncbi:YihY/virulence factor BrkB family protein [Eudoraea sp.]|uniref:YihY/virulence factor BrkB family protein n=1 Tax=Eudoraea sp. TaxID=1979955 RepID=UPI003C769524
MKFIKEVFNHFFESDTFQKGASLAYYTVFSLLPMIIIITSLLGLFFGKHAVSGEIYSQLKDVLGNDAAIQIQNIIKNQHTSYNSGLTTIIGFATLVFSASGMFSQIHDSFNSIWNIKAKSKSSILKHLSKHIVSFLILIASFFIILISTIISSFIVKHSDNFHSDYTFSYVYEHFLSFAVMSIVFALMFRFLGDAVINWKATIIGGIITSLLFIFGKVGIGMYIGHSHISSTFGSASVLALLMLWVYYTSQIIFLGASFIYVTSNRLGYDIQPNNNAVKIENVEIH